MKQHKRNIWKENVNLFQDCVKMSGGTVQIHGEENINEDVIVTVSYTHLNREQSIRYESERIKKED